MRRALSGFINGWVGESGRREAKRLAADPNATLEQMKILIAGFERDASHAHGMWEQTL